jgi:hypothetical protein
MTVRRIEIDRLELRLASGTTGDAGRSAAALDALGRAVANRLAQRLGALPAQDSALTAAAPRRIEISVPGGAANPGRIAEAVERRLRGNARTAPRRGR